jgi:hypothetical protein
MADSPQSRCTKLRAIMAPSDENPYGKSSNSLSKEADVHLNVFIKFLETGGSPEKFDATTGVYSTSHLRLLAEWIDNHDEPPPSRLRIIREGSESSSRTQTPSTSRRRGPPTPLDDFLLSIDEKLVVYAQQLARSPILLAFGPTFLPHLMLTPYHLSHHHHHHHHHHATPPSLSRALSLSCMCFYLAALV